MVVLDSACGPNCFHKETFLQQSKENGSHRKGKSSQAVAQPRDAECQPELAV